MLNQPPIRRILASLLLVLFAFGGTPKKFLHDWVANHKDTQSKFAGDTHTHVQKAIYSCPTGDQVIESPFIEDPAPTEYIVPQVYSGGFAGITARLYAFFPVRYSLRGPPACS